MFQPAGSSQPTTAPKAARRAEQEARGKVIEAARAKLQASRAARLAEIADLIHEKVAALKVLGVDMNTDSGQISTPATDALRREIGGLLRESAHLHGMTDEDLDRGSEYCRFEEYAFQQRLRGDALTARCVALAARYGRDPVVGTDWTKRKCLIPQARIATASCTGVLQSDQECA